MSGMTAGQAAYEARIIARRTRLLCAGESAVPEPPAWCHIGADQRADEEAGASAVASHLAADFEAARASEGTDRITHGLASQEQHANGNVHDAFGCRACLLKARAELATMTGARDDLARNLDRALAALQAIERDSTDLGARQHAHDALEPRP